MSSVIFNPFTPIPKSDKSHVRGWAMVWAQRLNTDIATKDTDISNYENIFFDHGVNFSGGLNLFGGLTDEVYDRLDNLIKAVRNGSNLWSLDYNIHKCKYIESIEKRIGASSTSNKVDDDFLVDLATCFSLAKTATMCNLPLSRLILGDSHSIAYSDPNQAICRINGQTLYSAMNKHGDLYDFIREHTPGYIEDDYEELTLCLGSIDIRFHALNKVKPREFAKQYAEKVVELQSQLNMSINVCAPVPIEHEGRRIPKTGQYKGVNFNGSRQERLNYTLDFIDELDNYCCDFKLIMPPKEWYEMDGEQYAKEIMELLSSVHIAPKNYKSVINWEK